jgi:tetratricopeptide (TPR) repeat protein
MYEWLRNGEIPATRIGERLWRIHERDIINPQMDTYLKMGLEHDSRGQVESGASAYRKAIEMNPRHALPYFCLGTMYYRWSHYSQAVEPLKKAIELNPEAFPAYMNLGMNYNHWGNHAEAEKYLRKAIELKPDHPEAHYQLGFSIMQQWPLKEDMGAAEHFRRAIDLNPEHGMAYHFLSWALIKAGDIRGARRLREELREKHPDQVDYITQLLRYHDPEEPKH